MNSPQFFIFQAMGTGKVPITHHGLINGYHSPWSHQWISLTMVSSMDITHHGLINGVGCLVWKDTGGQAGDTLLDLEGGDGDGNMVAARYPCRCTSDGFPSESCYCAAVNTHVQVCHQIWLGLGGSNGRTMNK